MRIRRLTIKPAASNIRRWLFVNVLGRPHLPASQEAALGPATDKCMRERPAQTTPPPPAARR